MSESLIEKKEQLYEGKAKKVFATANPDTVIIEYTDAVTAFNGGKKGIVEGKRIINMEFSARMFDLLEEHHVPTHFIRRLDDHSMLCDKVTVLPFELIVRNTAAGSFCRRLGLEEGTALRTTVYELTYKSDVLGDPLINDYDAVAVGAASWKELNAVYKYAAKINAVLCGYFSSRGVTLVDYKLVFGRNAEGRLVLADEISPDTCRFWDTKTGEKLDKDRFRFNLGGVKEAYEEMLRRTEQ